jgi:hypothetical protein
MPFQMRLIMRALVLRLFSSLIVIIPTLLQAETDERESTFAILETLEQPAVVRAHLLLVQPSSEERIKSPQEIQEELNQDEALFKEAQEMFNPWYTGPLLTGGAHMMPPGSANIQPYIFVTDTYGLWDSERDSVNISDKWTLNPQFVIQTGITNWLDILLAVQGTVNWQKNQCSGGYGDTYLSIGFPILEEGLYRPAIKVTVSETFPTGRYQNLQPKKLGLDSSGAGSYQTGFGIRISKLFFWSYKHPMNLRASYTYTIPSDVHVKGFNTYGGGHGTRGKVKPGNSSQADVAFEYSFTQRWVFATDVVYTWANKTTFAGKRGTIDGSPASVGGGSNDQLSLAPAIEYNWNANLGILGGAWFDVYGRNTSKFVSGILSVTYTFSW